MIKHPYKKDIEDTWRDMAVTRYHYKRFKSKAAKQAINKLRYLLILTIHNMEPGEKDERYY